MVHSPKKFGTHCDLVWGKLKLQTKKTKSFLKTTVKIFALATLILGLSTSSFAQSTSDVATASAKLLVPISIDNTASMDFGTLAVGATLGTVILGYDNTVSKTGGVTLLGGTPSTALFTVRGDGRNTFSITYPSSIILAGSVSGSLTVADIQCYGSHEGIGTLENGSLVLKVKGTLTVPAGSAVGTYTNSTGLRVTVNYN